MKNYRDLKDLQLYIGRTGSSDGAIRYYIELTYGYEQLYKMRGDNWRYMVKQMREELGLKYKHIETCNAVTKGW